MKIILEKNITKKNTKETGKKLYQSIVFCEEKLVFTCNCNS